MYLFEAVCAIQVRALAGGSPVLEVDRRIIATAREQAAGATGGVGPGALTWPALRRRLDRVDPGYRR
jgi:hypothetical protein